MTLRRRISLFTAFALALGLGGMVRGGTASDIAGLYYTGINTSGALLAGGSQDSNWTVTYASTNGGSSQSNTYKGSAYVVSSTYIDAGWTQNTASAQWIVAPGARTSAAGNSGTANLGGDYLPGNGDTGSNNGIYIYTLAFTIIGTGTVGSTVTNDVSISLTISADDQYRIYVNPAGNGTSIPTGTAAGSGLNAWNNTSAVTLQNGTNGTGTSGNSIFKIGTNYLTIVVENTNSATGSSGSSTRNPSGLLVYQVGSAAIIDGNPIPEVATWLPIVGAVGLYGLVILRRRRSSATVSL